MAYKLPLLIYILITTKFYADTSPNTSGFLKKRENKNLS